MVSPLLIILFVLWVWVFKNSRGAWDGKWWTTTLYEVGGSKREERM